MKFMVANEYDHLSIDTYEKAEEAARRYVSKCGATGRRQQAYVLQAVAEVKAPIPEAIVTKLT